MRIIILIFYYFLCLSVTSQVTYSVLKNDVKVISLKGDTVSIFSKLDSEKTVIVDISAVWCGPCWIYHETHVLDSLHQRKDFFVMFIEGDDSMSDSLLYGYNGKRNWTNSNYPIFDLKNDKDLGNELVFDYFPTIYMILPDRRFYNISPHLIDVGNVNNVIYLKNHFINCFKQKHDFFDKIHEIGK